MRISLALLPYRHNHMYFCECRTDLEVVEMLPLEEPNSNISSEFAVILLKSVHHHEAAEMKFYAKVLMQFVFRTLSMFINNLNSMRINSTRVQNYEWSFLFRPMQFSGFKDKMVL